MAEPIEQIIKIEVDKTSQQASLKAIDAIDQAFAATRKRIGDVGEVLFDFNDEILKLGRAKGIQSLIDEFPRLEEELGDSNQALELLLLKLAEIGASEDEVRDVARQFARLGDEAKKSAAPVSELDPLQKATQVYQRELDKLERSKSIDALVADFTRLQKKTGDSTKALDDLLKKLVQIGATEDEIAGVTRNVSSTGRRQAGALGRFGREVRALPAIQLSGSLSTDAIGKILYTTDSALGALGATATQVAGATLLAAPALIALGVAINNFNQQIEKSKAVLTGALSAQENYYQAVAELTTEGAQEQIDTLERTRPILQQQIEETQAAIAATFGQLQAEFGDAGARALIAAGQTPITQLEERLKELQTQFTASEQTATRLRQGMESGVFAANDMIEAEKRLAEERADEASKFLSDIEASTREEQRIRGLIEDGNREALEAERERLEGLFEVNREQRRAADEALDLFSAEDLAKMDADARQIQSDMARISGAISNLGSGLQAALGSNKAPLTQTVDEVTGLQAALGLVGKDLGGAEAEVSALSGALGNMTGTMENAKAAAAALAEEERKLQEERDEKRNQNILDTTERLVKAEAELARLRMEDADAAAALADEIARIQTEAQAEYDETIQEGVDRQLEIIEDAQDREAEIRKKFGKENANAIAERDAKAKYLADQNAEESLDENEKRLSEQLKKEQAALDKRLKAITENANKAITAEQRRFDKEDQIRERAIQQALVDQTNYQNGLAAITNNGAIRVRNNVTSIFGYMTQIGSAVENYWRQIAQSVIQQVAGMPTTPGTITPPTSPSPYGFGGASAEQAVRSIVNDQLSTLYQMAGRAG